MRHEIGSNTWKAYLNSRAGCDVQSAFLNRPSADGIIEIFKHMGLDCDPRAPITMPDHIFDALPGDETVLDLVAQRSILKKRIQKRSTVAYQRNIGTELGREYDNLTSIIAAAKTKRRNDANAQHRAEYLRQRHQRDTQQQIEGLADTEYRESMVQHQLEERSRL